MNNTIETQAVDVPAHEASEYLPALREPSPVPTTAAQAKTDAISALTISAYQRASQLVLNDEEVAALLADFPDEAFKPGAAGKENLLYLEHAFIRDRLNTVFRPGQWAIVPRSRWAEAFRTKPSRDNPQGLEASRVYVEAMLCIRGCFAAEAVGEMEYYPHNAGQNYGDAVEGAKTAALRRCAKELGIGLQAWKKDWCEGWWQRKRVGTKPQNAPPSPGVPPSSLPKPQTAPTRAEAPKTPTAASWTKRTPGEQKLHMERLTQFLTLCRTELINKLGPVMPSALEYAAKSGLILQGESLEDCSLGKLFPSVDWDRGVEENKLPVKRDFEAITAAIQSFMDGNEIPGAEVLHPMAMVPHPDPDPEATARMEIKVPRDEWFMNVIVPIPHKGQKRDEYMKAPDTIKSLYEQRHGTDETAQLARERLFGFVNHFQPKGWKKRDGTEMPPSAADYKFREALDAFSEFVEKSGEKL